MPALALAAEIAHRHEAAQIWYVGRRGSMEESFADSHGIGFLTIHAAPLKRGIVRMCAFLATMAYGIVEAVLLHARRRSHPIVGFGG